MARGATAAEVAAADDDDAGLILSLTIVADPRTGRFLLNLVFVISASVFMEWDADISAGAPLGALIEMGTASAELFIPTYVSHINFDLLQHVGFNRLLHLYFNTFLFDICSFVGNE